MTIARKVASVAVLFALVGAAGGCRPVASSLANDALTSDEECGQEMHIFVSNDTSEKIKIQRASLFGWLNVDKVRAGKTKELVITDCDGVELRATRAGKDLEFASAHDGLFWTVD